MEKTKQIIPIGNPGYRSPLPPVTDVACLPGASRRREVKSRSSSAWPKNKEARRSGRATQQRCDGGGAAGAVWEGPVPEGPGQSLPPASTLSLLKYAEANIIAPTGEKHNRHKEKKRGG